MPISGTTFASTVEFGRTSGSPWDLGTGSTQTSSYLSKLEVLLALQTALSILYMLLQLLLSRFEAALVCHIFWSPVFTLSLNETWESLQQSNSAVDGIVPTYFTHFIPRSH